MPTAPEVDRILNQSGFCSRVSAFNQQIPRTSLRWTKEMSSTRCSCKLEAVTKLVIWCPRDHSRRTVWIWGQDVVRCHIASTGDSLQVALNRNEAKYQVDISTY